MKRRVAWDTVIFTHVVVIGVPTILYYFLRVRGWELFWLHVAVATAYLITASMITWESSASAFRRFAGTPGTPTGPFDRLGRRLKGFFGLSGARGPEPHRPLPRCSFVVAAYLPNEQDIILETVRHVLERVRRPAAGLELILAYNRPTRLPIEDELERLAARHPELRLLPVAGSESKAENLNAAIQAATGQVIGILDADHHPEPDCLARAWRWLERGYDVVQGRNVVRNAAQSWLTRIVAIEFETIYGISHPARSLFVDTGIFAGSNGYWRADVLRRIRFDPKMLTEDIDATSRALLSGYRIVTDRSIVSTELAPADLRSFWFQRKRWAQGWLEVSLRHQRAFWASRYLSVGQKLYWTYLLYYRELYPPVSLQIFPVILSLLLYQGYMPLTAHWYLVATAVITLASGPYQTLVAMKTSYVRHPLSRWVGYALVVFFYALFKNMIAIVAVYDHVLGRNQWVVTRREMTKQLREEGNGA